MARRPSSRQRPARRPSLSADTQGLDEELHSTLQALGLAASAAQVDALSSYLDLLQHWNATYNLTAVRDRRGMLRQHLADCLALLPPLARDARPGRVLDVGSGGGLPGVVVAVMRPDLDVSCLDAVAKKAAFVRQVAGTLALRNLHALHGRVESLRAPAFDIITARAFADLARLTKLTATLLASGGAWVAMKGKVPQDEIDALGPAIEVFHVEQLLVPGLPDVHRCLVWMRPRKSAC